MFTTIVNTPDSFGRSLRSERERRGISLDAIADCTKIRRAFLVALERGDLGMMPPGVFRRGIVFAYAAAIGLEPYTVLANLASLSLEPGIDDRPKRMRLTLAPEPFWKTPAGQRVLAAAADTVVILLVGLALSLLIGTNPWVVAGAFAILYSVLGTLRFGQSPAAWVLTGGLTAEREREKEEAAWDHMSAFKPDWWADLVRRSQPRDPATTDARGHSG
jgi:hypothetical protein